MLGEELRQTLARVCQGLQVFKFNLSNGRASQIPDMLERTQMIPLATLPFSACGSQCLTNLPLVGRLSELTGPLLPPHSFPSFLFCDSSFFLFPKSCIFFFTIVLTRGIQI
ncbi:unnamed protein product [Arctogadus glacialis]